MANFDKALIEVLKNEGGYANDPDDLGGETYKGVSRKYWPNWQGWAVVDKLKIGSKEWQPALEQNDPLQAMVSSFYCTNFWNSVCGNDINSQEVALCIFDFAVNAGVVTSKTLAQLTCGVAADGVFGHDTLTKLNTINPELFITNFTLHKIIRYISICKKNPVQKKFFFNWIERAVE